MRSKKLILRSLLDKEIAIEYTAIGVRITKINEGDNIDYYESYSHILIDVGEDVYIAKKTRLDEGHIGYYSIDHIEQFYCIE